MEWDEIRKRAERVITRATEKGWWLTCAESCTGGLVAAELTAIPGASAAFLGGVVSYDNRIKEGVLGVAQETLARFGAVSSECAAEMAAGVRRLMKADCAVSITGIAGPGGGTPEKPVGLVHFGLASPAGTRTACCHFTGDRAAIRRQAVAFALGELENALK
ncbi:MAG: CinA family protein [Kiritimatiellae bacterium]|nr:CinA family protein [Kiritimatiellia bacterium]